MVDVADDLDNAELDNALESAVNAVSDVSITDERNTGPEEGGWKCIKCGNMNYAYRDRCNMRKCREPRPHFGGGDAAANANDNSNTDEDGKNAKKSKQMREGDWICKKCGNVNFATRVRCNMRKCQAPREEWVCKVCNNINYKFRTVCNMRKCQAPRPPESYPDYINMQRVHGRDSFTFPSQPSSIGHNQNYPQLQALLGPGFEPTRLPGHHFGHHPAENFSGPFRDPLPLGDHFGGHPGDHFSGHPSGQFDFGGPPAPYYRRDRTDRDAHGDELSNRLRRNRGVDSFPREMREGDWTCAECGNINFANRTQCNMRKCRAEKPL